MMYVFNLYVCFASILGIGLGRPHMLLEVFYHFQYYKRIFKCLTKTNLMQTRGVLDVFTETRLAEINSPLTQLSDI